MTDLAMIRRWCHLIHGRSAGLIHVCAAGNWEGRRFTTPLAAADYAAELDRRRPEGVYMRITSLWPGTPGDGRGGAAHSLELPALWADIDIGDVGHKEDLARPRDADEGRKIVQAAELPEPTAWVHSGGGLYPVWLLGPALRCDAADIDAAELAAGWQQAIARGAAELGFGYGTGVGDLARILRVPGTVNRKAGLERPCRILPGYGPVYTAEALSERLQAVQPPPAPAPAFRQPTRAAAGGTSPVDAYNATAAWADLLPGYGWRHVYDRGPVSHWCRPGKSGRAVSATVNALGTDRLHVFTDGAPPLVQGESYSKFGFLAAMEHGGDMSRAANALRGETVDDTRFFKYRKD